MTVQDQDMAHFRVQVAPDFVRAWATKPLSFDPQDWRLDLRAGLVAGLGGLRRDGRALSVRYWDRDKRIHDLENAVMYNVALVPFRAFLQAGLWFKRLEAPFLPTEALPGGEVSAEYSYDAVTPSALATATPRERLTFTFELVTPMTVRATWRAARRSLPNDGVNRDWSSRRLGMRVEAPTSLSAGALKPLLDGIVSALHVAEDDGTTARVLRGWGAQADELSLLTDGGGPLGPRRLITVAGDRPAWNPADDLFDELVVRCCQTDGRCAVEVYPLEVSAENAIATST